LKTLAKIRYGRGGDCNETPPKAKTGREMSTSAERRLAAEKFVEDWRGKGREKQDDQTFWNQFLREVMGLNRTFNEIMYQYDVTFGGSTKYIDAYIPESRVLIEQKSLGIDLDKPEKQSDGIFLSPYQQAERYAKEMDLDEIPRYIITSNFESFKIYDRKNDKEGKDPETVLLEELPEQYHLFDFILHPISEKLARQKQVNLEAARIIGTLYERTKEQYEDPESARHDLAVLMVRFLFCLYAEDSGLFEKNLFFNYLKEVPAGEGVFRRALIDLFKTLNTPYEGRDKYTGDTLKQFPYVNGGLFAEDIEIPIFNNNIKSQLLTVASQGFDWSSIDPTIFGAIFESILSGDERRAGGMHYTSTENIHKVIDPLFLDGLYKELDVAGTEKRKLIALQKKVASLNFLDPACGSGNFLTESYKELRRIENEIIRRLEKNQLSWDLQLDEGDSLIKVNVGQFYGIEINDFAVAVANTALWIADHQANQETSRIVERPYVNLPLKDYHHIVCENALRVDWNNILSAEHCDYIMGNPPFLGATNNSAEQKKEIVNLFGKVKLSNSIDYVGGWYYKATEYIQSSTILCAFVSTNSITQGEIVAPLWGTLFERFDIDIIFAYRTFIWDSESGDSAHVHCVIIGFSAHHKKEKLVFDGNRRIEAKNINPYLIDAPNVFVESRAKPLCNVPVMKLGNKPSDGGSLIVSDDERSEILIREPALEKYILPYVGAREFINGGSRWCFWLQGADLGDFRKSKELYKRLEEVREFRLASTAEPTRKMAETPYKFFFVSQPDSTYLLIPSASSQRRDYVPIGFMPPRVISSNLNMIVPNATLYHFGITTSHFHNAWMRAIAGRLKSDYRYSGNIVYNNFIWPNPTDEKRQQIESLAQAILDARANYPDSSLADLYDPITMPPDLYKAHKALDKAVEQAYGVNFNGDEEKIVAYLFRLYAEATKTD
jgi:type I restriction-modification system DNA methylase subunit